MSFGTDGIENHAKARPDCIVCRGGGILDDGDNYGACFVPCPCTGESYPDVVRKVTLSLL